MTVEWTEIKFSSADQPYVLTAPCPAQRRRTVNGRTFGWAGKVARFITGAAERAARVVYNALCARIETTFAAAKKAARELEVAKFVRHQLHAFGSDEGDEGGLRTVPFAARTRAASTAEALFGPRRLLRGEV